MLKHDDPKFLSIPNPCFYAEFMIRTLKDYKFNITIYMLWIRRKSPIEGDIRQFAASRRHYLTTQNHVEHLREFIKITGIDKYDDLNEIDIKSYLDSINLSINRESQKLQIAQSLFLFLRFKKLNIINSFEKRGRGRPEKVERNNEIYDLYTMKKYTYEDIAKEKGLKKPTVFGIVRRMKSRIK